MDGTNSRNAAAPFWRCAGGDAGRTGKKPHVIGSTGDKDALFAEIDRDGWNACHVIAKGNTLIHLINGKVMSIVVDGDPHERTRKGLIGMQVHVGPR